MQVIKITSPEQLQSSPSERMTNEQLQNEYNYIRAEQITRKVLEGRQMDIHYRPWHPFQRKIHRRLHFPENLHG